jgi:phosphopantothenoylcysteine decarboxylase/phosphopantothenate--cysteine ligase
MDLASRRIVVGMTGGVAAYKVCELVRRLQDEGAKVQVVMTGAAQQFVTATTMQALSGQPVFTDQWGAGATVANAMPHIDLTRGVDAIVVAPATAHFIAKTALGLADDLLSTLVLARNRATTGLLVAPAMNVEMWENPATRRNVAQLAADGIVLLGPAAGDQACGEVGMGRMLEPRCRARWQRASRDGVARRLNRSTRYAHHEPSRARQTRLARAAADAGEVTLVAGPICRHRAT